MACYRRLPLDGLKNARDLGGYPAADGGITRYRVFVRSELPRRLSERDVRFLKDAGITEVFDFRGREEVERLPDVLALEGWIRYINLPMFDENAAGAILRNDPVFSWGEHYIGMVKSHMPWVRDVFTGFANASGPVLFHCMTGKDRTGIVAALLLSLAGVAEEDILADYAVSQIYLREMYLKMNKAKTPWGERDLSDPFFSTAPENMEALCGYLKTAFGGAREYLLACGLDGRTLDAIAGRLVESRHMP